MQKELKIIKLSKLTKQQAINLQAIYIDTDDTYYNHVLLVYKYLVLFNVVATS